MFFLLKTSLIFDPSKFRRFENIFLSFFFFLFSIFLENSLNYTLQKIKILEKITFGWITRRISDTHGRTKTFWFPNFFILCNLKCFDISRPCTHFLPLLCPEHLFGT
jgi:hypothetical protein